MAQYSTSIKLGDAVLLSKAIGVVLYIGPVQWNQNKNEIYAGLELSTSISNGHNGTYNGYKYFKCKPKHGIILPIY